jgi:hypothetical protein
MSAPRASRRDHLTDLAASNLDEMTVLRRLAAWHNESDQNEISFRQEPVGANDRIFPLPDALLPLTMGALAKSQDLLEACETESDQLLVATFGMYLLTAIHPFENGNGRVAFDFAQYLLMKAWEEKTPPLFYESDTHDVIAQAFTPLDEGKVARSEAELEPAMKALFDHIGEASLPELWTLPPLVAAAHFLANGSRLPFTARQSMAS